ncbi:MAG: hypothetical protein GF421_05295 [Candidatus Aminicenantes bacterium]|nr:hypothetical protein [Candidatus Aminicenantes bacterium]
MNEKQKDEYIKAIDARIKELNAELDRLEARANRLKAESKIEMMNKIKQMKEQKKRISSRLIQIKEKGEEAWEDLKKGLSDSVDELSSALKSAASRFKK